MKNLKVKYTSLFLGLAMMAVSAIMLSSYDVESAVRNAKNTSDNKTQSVTSEASEANVSGAKEKAAKDNYKKALIDKHEAEKAASIVKNMATVAKDNKKEQEDIHIEIVKAEEETAQPVVEEPVEYSSTFRYYPTEDELNMMCAVVSSETGYCEDMAQKAVAHTIINRLASDAFPNDMYSVLTQENQYTAVDCYFTGNYRPELYPGSERWNHTMQLCCDAFEEYDFTNGAVAYYNPQMIGYNSWFESLVLTYEDQYGRFFKLP